jgi:RNA polymerase sigma-32 factor
MSDKKIIKSEDIEILEPEVETQEEAEGEDDAIEIVADEDEKLPVIAPSREISKTDRPTSDYQALNQYLREIERYPLLTLEEEKELTKAFAETGDIELAKQLVQANLRLVVKIAMEYRKAHQNIMDLIQEGNIGLMKAVSKYDPGKGAKLSYYASWWIKSYILKFILDNFRLVKIGTTAEQKKLFYNLMKEKDRLKKLGIEPTTEVISQNLGVSEKSVELMDARLDSSGSELSLDYKPFDDDARTTLADLVSDEGPSVEEQVGHAQNIDILKSELHDFIASLKERDREIFKKRLLSEVPPSLQAIADDYGVSRERIRQIEERLLKKLKVYMADFLR